MNFTVKEMIAQEKVENRIKEIAAQINKDYEGKSVHLVCILKGSIFFTCELAKYITLPVTIDFMQCSSYGADTKSSGIVKLAKDLDEPITGRHTIIIEDIIDSGRTLSHLVKLLSQREPASLQLCTLLDKPDRRVVEVDVKYVGFEIPDKFVVGFGLDYDQKMRNLPYIGEVVFEQ